MSTQFFTCVNLFSAADLTAGDSMAMLEAKAQQLAEEAKKDTPKGKPGNISFIRLVEKLDNSFFFIRLTILNVSRFSAVSTEEANNNQIVADATNPDEIQLDEDDEMDDAEEDKTSVKKKGKIKLRCLYVNIKNNTSFLFIRCCCRKTNYSIRSFWKFSTGR